MTPAGDARTPLRWAALARAERAALAGKLVGLYGAESDAAAFAALAVDKQQALLLLAGRLRQLELWSAVRRVENVYGLGGVGMNFAAWPLLASALRRHKDFATHFARHGDTAGGFLELGRRRAALHFLYTEDTVRRWAVHFDWHGPLASPLSALRHLYYEKWRGLRPDWRAIRAALAGDITMTGDKKE